MITPNDVCCLVRRIKEGDWNSLAIAIRDAELRGIRIGLEAAATEMEDPAFGSPRMSRSIRALDPAKILEQAEKERK